MKAILTSLFSLFVLSCAAQGQHFFISPAIDIREAGCNKVLCLKNGNTLLFHFDLGKKISVTVFDSTHKQIASRRDENRVFDRYLLESAVFKGLYDINNEAVLFFEQDMSGKPSLIRLRYSAFDGSLIEERLVGESKSENRRIKYYVMKNKTDDNYEILFCMDKRHPKESDIFVVYFDKYHKSLKEVHLEVDRKKYDYLEVIGAESQPEGLIVTIGLDKTKLYGGIARLNNTEFAASDHDSDLTNGASVFEHYISCYFLKIFSFSIFFNKLLKIISF